MKLNRDAERNTNIIETVLAVMVFIWVVWMITELLIH